MVFKYSRWAIFTVWLFHISALLGISLGFEAWFVEKTPLNLLISSTLLFLVYPINTPRKYFLFLVFWTGGMLAEWIGVHFGVLFGSYSYGENLGPKIDGIPILIGVNWALLTFITWSIATYLSKNNLLQLFLGASLMVLLDFFMEQNASRFNFWSFEGNIVPLKNYICWFLLALLFQWVLQRNKISGYLPFAVHLFAAQLLFFVYFYLWF